MPHPRRTPAGILVAAFLALALAPLAEAQGSLPIARLSRFRGSVQVIRLGAPVALYPDLPLSNGDQVLTRDGYALVVFNDRTEIRVKPQTKLGISESAGKREVDVFFGKLWAYVVAKKDKVTNFRHGGTIAAVRGTFVEFDAGEEGELGLICFGVSDGTMTFNWLDKGGVAHRLELRPSFKICFDSDGNIAGQPTAFQPGEVVDPDMPFEDGDQAPTETRLRAPCAGCQIYDVASDTCVDFDPLCPDTPCFRDRRCVSAVCTGGRRVISAEDPNCP